jgi:hypothetical protein
MKTRLTFPTTLSLALFLALAPCGARPEANEKAKSPVPAGSGRQAIITKLELIRLDNVKYDGLPLSEVVLQLRDEAKKRDPEKKGINFLINQNPDPGEAIPAAAPMLGPDGNPLPASPAEQVDMSAVFIKIQPPLYNLRLMDLLDAVVMVADKPIKYSIEDYGVVFSPRGSEPAKGENLANALPATGEGRQVISNKLELIRLDNVKYDGLPLSEVVLQLRDEAKKRDPENKGINFLMNQNLDPGEATPAPAVVLGPNGQPVPAPPTEQVDLSAISIKISPPLNDVRLVDVLDAVVKVADRPIKYSIEDYGVVFSPRGPGPAQMEEHGFAFPGGTPSQFLDAVQRQYQVDWLSVADIPKELTDVHIPRLRINQESVGVILAGKGAGGGSLEAVVSLYNQLWENNNALGRLVVKGDLTKPSIVMFVRDPASTDTQPRIKVKAFSISGASGADRAKLVDDIGRAREEAMSYAMHLRGPSALRNLEGTVAIHDDTSLLVATGSEAFVDMVESIVAASQAKDQARRPPAGTPEGSPKGK